MIFRDVFKLCGHVEIGPTEVFDQSYSRMSFGISPTPERTLSLNLLGRLCQQGTVQPEVNRLVGELYRALLHVVIAAEFPRRASRR